jgi:hypothetical protein
MCMLLYCAFVDIEYGCSQYSLLCRLNFVLAIAAERDRKGFYDASEVAYCLQPWCKKYFKKLEILAGGMIVLS